VFSCPDILLPRITKLSCAFRWLFPNETFTIQNAFQILLTGEVTKSNIFHADVVIVYINPGGCHHDRDRMAW
jgi:hypothetical protein